MQGVGLAEVAASESFKAAPLLQEAGPHDGVMDTCGQREKVGGLVVAHLHTLRNLQKQMWWTKRAKVSKLLATPQRRPHQPKPPPCQRFEMLKP